ncbi:hypothetical protein [Cryobacterium sp.]|uniref:hypothetical protein n=1 Tax=Cryobacterium sp. TaxID=1926290 RepID=UPI00262131EB|nr:hypothetical protein [Cryobacterium sp.]
MLSARDSADLAALGLPGAIVPADLAGPEAIDHLVAGAIAVSAPDGHPPDRREIRSHPDSTVHPSVGRHRPAAARRPRPRPGGRTDRAGQSHRERDLPSAAFTSAA